MLPTTTANTTIHGKAAENRRQSERLFPARPIGGCEVFDLSKDIAGRLD
jgi:hypothetical protein